MKDAQAGVAPAHHETPLDLDAPPGTVRKIERNRGFVVKCSDGLIVVLGVQLEGKKETDAWSFLQGCKLQAGDRLL